MRYVLDAIVNWHGFPLALVTKDDKTGVIQTYEHWQAPTKDYHDVKVVDQDCTWGDLFSMYPSEDISKLDTAGLLGYFEGRGRTSYAGVDPSDYKTYWMQYDRYKHSKWFDTLGSNIEDRSLTPNLLNNKEWKPVCIPFSSQTFGVAVIAVENTVWHYIDYFVITYNELTGYFIGTGADLGKLIHNGYKSLFELFRPLESYSWELQKLCLVDDKLYWVHAKTSISLISATYSLIGLTSELEDTDMADMSWFLISIMS